MEENEILKKVKLIYKKWKIGELGGEYMPEDSNPGFNKESKENYHFFTLPMALNYQRNSYKLWESCLLTYNDKNTKFVFDIDKVLNCSFDEVKLALTKYKIALQQNKQTEIWIKLCKTIKEYFNGDIRTLFKLCDYNVNKIKNYVQVEHKKDFPYLSGDKISNYWLYVLHQYTDIKLNDLNDLSIAPDTHVIQASKKLNVITEEEFNKNNVQKIVADRWKKILYNSEFSPIDIHTPLWLWSRSGLKDIFK